jgi:hypothetical protein
MMRLSKFIQDHMEELLSDCESFAQTLLPAGKTLNQDALRDDARQTGLSSVQYALFKLPARRPVMLQIFNLNSLATILLLWLSSSTMLGRALSSGARASLDIP